MRFIKEAASTLPCLLQPLDSLSSPGLDESRSMQLPGPAETAKYDVKFDMRREELGTKAMT